MRVVTTGATGNVGTSVVAALSADPAVSEVVGVSRRRPGLAFPKVAWREADVARDDLVELFRGADAVIHLAWLIQPARHEDVMRAVNVDGSRRVFAAVAEAGVPTLLYASSVGTYAVGPKDREVDESWSTDGVPTSFYSRHKAEVERLLDRFEHEHPGVRVVRFRKGLIFKHEAASGVSRLFLGPLLPPPVVSPTFVPVVPDTDRLRFQAVHSLDVGEAYRLALHADVRGAFNIAAPPSLGPPELAAALRARRVRVPRSALRLGADLTYRLRVHPTEPGWVDLALGVPLMDARRARDELGWRPRHTAIEAFEDLLHGMRHRLGVDTPVLAPRGGRLVTARVPSPT